MKGHKIVSSADLRQAEQEGDHQAFMQEAGRKVAEVVLQYIEKNRLPKKVTLLVGKGNNGGDAYAAGLFLLEEGLEVSALVLYEEGSDLNAFFRDKFRKKGGRFTQELEGLLIDGLLGTGFRGKLEKKIALLIQRANSSSLPIVSIDIPSGLDAEEGKVQEIAIFANQTVCLGAAKMGLFLEDGWAHVGKLFIENFGLSDEKIALLDAQGYLPKTLELPQISRIRHKYQAGYIVGYAGSKKLSGAAKMAGFAALRAGAGMVRLFHPEEIGPAPYELICHKWDLKEWKKELEKAQAVLIGPGLLEDKRWLQTHLKEIKVPCVVDAGALLHGVDFPKGSVLTPHRGEVLRLLGLKTALKSRDLFAKITQFCARKELFLVLKGAPTFIFGPKHKPTIVPRGDPGMASAGTGDVLTGMIAAFLAQGASSYEAALLGVCLHAISGEKAAESLTSYCVTAMDLITFMPAAFQDVLKGRDIV